EASRRHGTRRARPSAVTYSALFSEQVQIRQIQENRKPGQLDCDELRLIFDLGREPRAASSAPASQEAVAKAETKRPAAPAASQPARPRTRIAVTWVGPLEMRPVEGAKPPSMPGRRFDVIATGKKVVIKDEQQGEALCTRMIYRNDQRAVWLT